LVVTRPDYLCKLALLCIALSIAGCATRKSDDGPPRGGSSPHAQLPPDAVPRKEARSRYGNPADYEVYGIRYNVLNSSYGYQERGVASWYGKKFHGRQTSSQEPYDMYAMTAAHKTLPLPTYVRVRNLRNNKSIVVRVNDRGPFVDNRIIDLSYSAAIKLDMISSGTALVEVTALSYDDPPPASRQDMPTRAVATASQSSHAVYVQVGAFGDIKNAKRRFALLHEGGIEDAFVHKDESQTPALYRIRIGPVRGVDDYDALVRKLANIGVTESHLVTN
jgi:peptidoglycan lytic transglycosylase